MIQCSIRGLLTEQVQALRLAYGVQFIVNCSGLGSIELAGDKELFPVRGITSNDFKLAVQLVYVKAWHLRFHNLTSLMKKV